MLIWRHALHRQIFVYILIFFLLYFLPCKIFLNLIKFTYLFIYLMALTLNDTVCVFT